MRGGQFLRSFRNIVFLTFSSSSRNVEFQKMFERKENKKEKRNENRYLIQISRTYRRNGLTETVARPSGSRNAIIVSSRLRLYRFRSQELFLLVIERNKILLHSHFQRFLLAARCTTIGYREIG